MSRRGDDEIKKEFGRRLQRALMDRGLNQTQAANKCGVTRSNVSDWIIAKNLPSPANLKKLADGLDMKPEDLLPSDAYNEPESDLPTFSIRELGNGKVYIQVNRPVSKATASKISAAILDDGD
mgnify:FL=1